MEDSSSSTWWSRHKTKCSICCGYSLVLLGLAGLLIAVYIPPLMNDLIDSGIDDYIILSPDHQNSNDETWRTWADSTDPDAAPPDYQVYIYNITNPYEVLNGSKPNLVEFGPYIYTYNTKRFNISWTTDEESRQTLQYKEWPYWVFNRAKTAPQYSESDIYTQLNSVFFEIGAAFYGLDSIMYEMYPDDSFTDFDRLFITNRTVHEVLWGYLDPVLEKASKISGGAVAAYFNGVLGPNITSQDDCNNNNYTLPSLCGFNRILTGDKYPDQVQQFSMWQGMDTMICQPNPKRDEWEGLWNTAAANAIWGTGGMQFHKHVDPNETIVAWVPTLFRRVSLQNIDQVTYKVKGITLNKFIIDPDGMTNYTFEPFNAPYNQNVSGILDISRAWGGVPIVMSKPHFLDGDISVSQNVEGLVPNQALHETYLGVERTTGTVMDAHNRVQINTKIYAWTFTGAQAGKVWFPDVIQGIIFPNCWVDETGQLTDKQANEFKDGVYLGQNMAYYGMYVGSIAGSIFIVLGVALVHYTVLRSSQMKSLSSSASSEPLITN